MLEGENQGNVPGASGSPEPQTPVATPTPTPEPTPTPVAPTAKVEVKDGKVTVDGKGYVAESDLIAAKKSLEGKLEQQQTAHDTATDATKVELSQAQTTIATLNAKVQETEEARAAGAISNEEAARVKQELEAAKGSAEQSGNRALEYRRALIVLNYGVPADTIKDKTMEQLDSFEEAARALQTSKGTGSPGAYAVGGGGAEAAPQTNEERAHKILEATPVRGVRTAETQ